MRAVESKLVVAVFAALSLGGCPAVEEAAPEGVAPGAYWVEQREGTLEAYAMPKYRGDTGRWLALSETEAEWYTGAALYEVDEGGRWQRLTRDETLNLDTLMQVWDPPPRVEAPAGATSTF